MFAELSRSRIKAFLAASGTRGTSLRTRIDQIRSQRRRIDAWHDAQSAVRAGETWSIGWGGSDAHGSHMTYLVTGRVREDEAGELRLGEAVLGRPYRRLHWWEGIFPGRGFACAVRGSGLFAEALDTMCSGDPVEQLWRIASGTRVAVQWRDTHDSCVGARFFVCGVLGPSQIRAGRRGRPVGDEFIDEYLTLERLHVQVPAVEQVAR